MSGVQETSLQAYREIQPTKGTKQAIVYKLLADATRNGFDMTNNEVAHALGWPICCVTGRMWELRNEKSVVVLSQVRRCGVTRRKAMAWKTKEA